MKKERTYTEINTNIINHLCVPVPCPQCEKPHPLSLGMTHRGEWIHCPDCNSRMSFALGGHNKTIIDFAQSFKSLHVQLHKMGLPLAFFHEPFATIRSRNNKS